MIIPTPINGKDRLSNLKEWVEVILEPIVGIVISKNKYGQYPKDIPDIFLDRVLTREEALPLLNYEFNAGYGSGDCHPIYIWTDVAIYFIKEYDGSLCLQSVPRHPCMCKAEHQ